MVHDKNSDLEIHPGAGGTERKIGEVALLFAYMARAGRKNGYQRSWNSIIGDGDEAD